MATLTLPRPRVGASAMSGRRRRTQRLRRQQGIAAGCAGRTGLPPADLRRRSRRAPGSHRRSAGTGSDGSGPPTDVDRAVLRTAGRPGRRPRWSQYAHRRAEWAENRQAVRGCLGGGHHEGGHAADAVDPAHELLAVCRRQRLEHRTAPDADQEEQAPSGERKGLEQFVDGGDVSGRLGGDQRVHLEGQAQFAGPVDGGQRAHIGALDATDRVVALRGGPVKAQPEAGDPMLGQRCQDIPSERVRRRRSDGDLDAQAAGLVDEGQQVSAFERVTAGEDEGGHRVAEPGDLPDERQALFVGQFTRVRVGHGGCPAVAASERARLGHLPVDVERGERVIPGSVPHGITIDQPGVFPTPQRAPEVAADLGVGRRRLRRIGRIR